MKILLTKDQEALVENGSKLVLGDNEYYFIPFWFKKLSDGTWEQHLIDNLPTDLKHEIQKLKENE